jgi:hypothetical protein
MNIKHRGMLYALGGIVIGASGGVGLHAQSTATAPAYYVVEVNVRDLDTYKNDYAAHVAGVRQDQTCQTRRSDDSLVHR